MTLRRYEFGDPAIVAERHEEQTLTRMTMIATCSHLPFGICPACWSDPTVRGLVEQVAKAQEDAKTALLAYEELRKHFKLARDGTLP